MSTGYDRMMPLQGDRIGIFGKGGAGKSTVTVLLALAMREVGYEVCILDADSTNVGTERALGIQDRPSALIDYFGGMIFAGGSVGCPVDDPTRLAGATIGIAQLPERFYRRTDNGIIFMTAGKLADYGVAPGCDGPMTKIARDLAITSAGIARQPILLVDCKAGFEDSARGLVTGLDWALVVVDPSVAGIQMAVTICRMAESLHQGAVPATEHLKRDDEIELARSFYRNTRFKGALVILNKMRTAATQEYVESILLAQGIRSIGAVSDDALVAGAWLDGGSLLQVSARRELGSVLKGIEQAEQKYPRKAG